MKEPDLIFSPATTAKGAGDDNYDNRPASRGNNGSDEAVGSDVEQTRQEAAHKCPHDTQDNVKDKCRICARNRLAPKKN